MSEQTKIENRVMADYSIAKSYKGILRIAHIMQYDVSEKDTLFNPYYYGNPTALMDISGGSYSSKEYGYPTAISGLTGTSNRYTSENPSIGNDELKLHRVPLTDSMGNYLNWNIGLDGVTIGSNEDISGNKYSFNYFYQSSEPSKKIAQEKIFPVIKSKTLYVGLVNKLINEQKFRINDSSVQIQSREYDNNAQLIIENKYDKTDKNKETILKLLRDEQGNVVTSENDEGISENVLTESTWKTYTTPARYIPLNEEAGHPYSKIRTVYNDTKGKVQDYDVFMYRQDDWDVDNWDSHTINTDAATGLILNPIEQDKKFLDCHVDITNLKDYIKQKIAYYLNGNVIEVPSGAVIWQYVSPKKWYGGGTSPDGTTMKDYAGNRPSMSLRVDDSEEKYFKSLIQGACRKINHMVNESQADNLKEQENDDDSMEYNDRGDYLNEVIPLYKRDYVLCDGTKYRIPYRPIFSNARITNQREAFDRFLNLFFAIGYKYTERKNLALRPLYRINENGVSILQAKNKIIDNNDIDTTIYEQMTPTTNKENYYSTNEEYSVDNWIGNVPYLVQMTNARWNNLDDFDVLFGMDLATMIACDMIYTEYNTNSFGKSPDIKWNDMKPTEKKELIMNWLKKDHPIDEKYIFNTFVTDTEENVKQYFANTYGENWTEQLKKLFNYTNKNPLHEAKVMSIPYYNFVKEGTSIQSQKDVYPIIHMGREVNNISSFIKVYDPCAEEGKQYKAVKIYNLPNVQLFIDLLCTKHYLPTNLNKFCYMYFNYDFQVPNLYTGQNEPTFIGSSGIRWSDARNRETIKVESWSSNFTSTSIPHRHALFCSPIQGFNKQDALNLFKGQPLSNSTVSGSACRGGSLKANNNRKDDTGSYIVNEIVCVDNDGKDDKDNQPNVVGTRIKLIHIPPSSDISFDNIVTGKYRKDIKSTSPYDDFKDVETITWEEIEHDKNSGQLISEKLEKYYNYEKPYWFSFRIKDDPRFETAEPNRGITSSPYNIETYNYIKESKSEINKRNFGSDTVNFVSCENQKLLPLIKI